MAIKRNRIRFAAAAVLIVAIAGSARAATQSPQGITVSPAYQQIAVQADESAHPFSVSITNHETNQQTINVTTQDFNTLSETGGLVFVGSNPTQLQKKYGLAKWLKITQNNLTIQPGQTVKLNAEVLNLPTLAPGGHYGAIMLSIGNPSAKSGGSVSLHPIASSLLFVTKLGGDTHKLRLESVSYGHTLFKLPSGIVLNFYNSGNSHVVPRGVVSLYKGGRLVSKGIINEGSSIVLPETSRRLTVPLQNVSSAFSIGKYTLKVDYRFDGYDQYRRYQASFVIVPWYFFATVFALLIILIVGVKVSRNLRSWR